MVLDNKQHIYVLGAGRGSRLGSFISKPLVKLDNDSCLLEIQIKHMFGNRPFSVITGYKEDLYNSLDCHTISNPDWELGIISSIKTALEDSRLKQYENIIIIDGDLLLSKEAFDNLYQTKNSILLVDANNIELISGLNNIFLSYEDNRLVYSSANTLAWGCAVNLEVDKLTCLLCKDESNDLFISKLIGEKLEPVVEKQLYIEVDEPENLQVLNQYIKDMSQDIADQFWVSRVSDYPSRLIQDARISKQREELEIKFIYNTINKYKINTDNVLDLGAGNGFSTGVVKPTNRYDLVDLNNNYVQTLKELVKYEERYTVTCCNILDYVIKHRYDLYFLLGVIQYIIDDSNLESLFAKIAESMDDNSFLLLRNSSSLESDLLINNYSEDLNSEYSAKYRTIKSIDTLLRKVNLKIIEWQFLLPKELDSKYGTRQVYFVITKC